MGKRFTDTDIWDKEWFMKLKPKHKCLVKFIFDKCDVAGVWSPNWTLASAYVGEKCSNEDLKFMKSQLEILPDGKVFVFGFVVFQYGNLSEKCKPHIKIISLLKKYNLFERVLEGYVYPFQRVEEKEEDREMEKEEEKDIIKKGVELKFVFESEEFKNKWAVLVVQKKWKGKSKEALQESLDFLSKYTEQDAIEIIRKSIAGGWQGLFDLDKKESLKTPLKSNKIDSALQTNQEVKENLKVMFSDESTR